MHKHTYTHTQILIIQAGCDGDGDGGGVPQQTYARDTRNTRARRVACSLARPHIEHNCTPHSVMKIKSHNLRIRTTRVHIVVSYAIVRSVQLRFHARTY